MTKQRILNMAIVAIGMATKSHAYNANNGTILYYFMENNLTLNNASYNFSTTASPSYNPSASPTINPSAIPSSYPSSSPTLIEISYVEEIFEQTLTGYDLVGMTKLQRKAYRYFLMNSTIYYGPYGGEPIVQTNCTIKQQILEDSSSLRRRRILTENDITSMANTTTVFDFLSLADDDYESTTTNLTLLYSMKWSSIYKRLNISHYIISYLDYMNTIEGQMRNINHLHSLGINVTNITSLEVYVPPGEEKVPTIEVNFSDVSSWNVLAVTGLFTLCCTIIFIIVYEVGRRNPIVSVIFDKRRMHHPQRTPPPLRKDRYFQWLFLKTDIQLFQLSTNGNETCGGMSELEESKEEIEAKVPEEDSTCGNTTFDTSQSGYDSKHAEDANNEVSLGLPEKGILSTISERISYYSQKQDDQNIAKNTNFVCVNGRHVPPEFSELAISGILTETNLIDCEKIVKNSIKVEARKKSSRTSFLTRIFSDRGAAAAAATVSNSTTHNTDEEIVIDCEHCRERVDRSSLHKQTSQLKSMIEKGRHDFDVADILLLQSVGLDQFVFIRFLRFCFDVTFYPFILACITLIPTYYTNPYDGEISHDADTLSIVTDGYFRITMNRLEKGSNRLYVCFFYALIYRIFLLYRLYIEWDSFYAVRCEFLANGDSEMIITQHGGGAQVPMEEKVRQFRHSCMVQSVPLKLRGDKELFDFFNQVFPGQVKRVELVLTCPLLRKLISKRQKLIEAYEKVYAKHHYAMEKYRMRTHRQRWAIMDCFNKEPAEPMIKIKNGKFKRLAYYMNEIKSLNILANNERLRLEQQKTNAVKKNSNLSNHVHRVRSLFMPAISNRFASGTAFVEFNNLATVQSAIQCNITGSRNCMTIRSAPDPRELRWDNVAVDREFLRIRYLFSNCLLLVGTLFWAPLVTLITTYSNVDKLSRFLPAWMMPQPDTFWHAFIEGYFPVLVLETLMVFVVQALGLIAKYYICFKTASESDRFVFQWHFGYRLTNIFVVIISGSLKEIFYAIETDLGYFLQMVTQGFSYSSQFFLDNVIFTAGNGNFWELAQGVKIIKCFFMHKFIKADATSKRVLKRVAKADRLNWGECLPEYVFTLMVAIMYCTSTPIILGACALCFFLASKVFLHQALYIYSPRYESGGLIMYYLNRATFITIYTTNIMFALLLGMKGKEYLGLFFFLLANGATVFIDLRIRNKYITTSTKLALVNARMIDEKTKHNEGKEIGNRPSNTASLNNKPHVDTLETFSYDKMLGDSVGFIPPSLHEASRVERIEQDFYVYIQPEMNIDKWEIEPQPYR